MDLYFVRHGETDENKQGIIQGWLDTQLNQEGQRQASDAAAAFDHDIDAIVSSDLVRCRQTAEHFRVKYPNIPYLEDERLRERNFGDAQGVHKEQQDWEVFWAATDTVSIPHAETLKTFNERVLSFLDDARKHLGRSALVVTHGGTINRVKDITSERHTFTPIKNSSVTHIVL